MKNELISKKTRYEFREFLASWTLREIELEFDSADIICNAGYEPNVSGARRSLIEKYYASIEFTNPHHIKKVIKAFENILNKALDQVNNSSDSQPDWSKQIKNHTDNLLKFLARDGFVFKNGYLSPVTNNFLVGEISAKALEFNDTYLQEQISRIEASINSDPTLAIGSAKELVETCCKTILSERSCEVMSGDNLPKLVKKTLKILKLLPADIPEEVKGEKAIKALLGSLSTITQTLSSLNIIWR